VKFKKRLNVLVSAGPTREPIDPVRFISNYSTGFFGYQIAKEAKNRGHRVVLISGPTALARPQGVRRIDVQTAAQMREALKKSFSWCDCLVMSAAVCDFRPQKTARRKIKRGAKKEITLRLKQNPDILKGLGRRKGKRLLVGVALDTEGLKARAQRKLRQKNLDLIVATPMRTRSYPFGPARMDVLIIDRNGRVKEAKAAKKTTLSRILLDSIEKTVLS
jgi:phosphopantothenoylcysteine decarboxylase/phosphopantothenate--cysteine ligase